MLGIGLFTVGSIVFGVAQNIGTMLAGRCIQGLGAGGFVSMAFVTFADVLSVKARGEWLAQMAIALALRTVLGQ